MKATILFTATIIFFSSCSDIYSVYNRPGYIDWYQDKFKNTETVELVQDYLATNAYAHKPISTILTFQKQLNTTNPKTILKLKLNAAYSESIQPKFFFQLDDERLEFPFNEVSDHRLEKEKIVIEIDEESNSSEKTYDQSINLIKTSFTLPIELQQKITDTKKRLTIRFYIDDKPYNINLLLEDTPSKMEFLRDFLKIKTENDYIRHRQKFAGYYLNNLRKN